VTNLPAAVAAIAKSAPATATRSPGTPNDLKPGEEDAGPFQQELTREIGALHKQAATAESAARADLEHDQDDGVDGSASVGVLDPSIAAMLIGAVALPQTVAAAVQLAATAAAAVASAPGDSPATDAAVATMASAGTTMASAGTARASFLESQAQASIDASSAAPIALSADAKADRAGKAAMKAPVESGLAASAAPAESAAGGKFVSDDMQAVASPPQPLTQAAAPAPLSLTQATVAAMAAHLAASGRERVQGERSVRMANQQTQSAERRLDPADIEPGQGASSGSNEKTHIAAADALAAGKFLQAGRDGIELRQSAAPEIRQVQHQGAEALMPGGMNMAATAPTQTAQAATATIAAHLDAPGWDRGLGEKMMWMAGRKMQVAELHLNPPELGPLQITLSISNDQASAQFVSQHAAVREAIETAMPRLREMLAEGGITLGNASVSAESSGGQAQAQQDARNHVPRSATQADAGTAFRSPQPPRATRGLVDIFA
jgi:flagellar hook-length control protein FliK